MQCVALTWRVGGAYGAASRFWRHEYAEGRTPHPRAPLARREAS